MPKSRKLESVVKNMAKCTVLNVGAIAISHSTIQRDLKTAIAARVVLINVGDSALPSHWHFICHSCYKNSVQQKSLFLEKGYSMYIQ